MALFEKCVSLYEKGNSDFNSYYEDEERDFLTSIGCKKREFFDFVEDFVDDGKPNSSTALLVAAVRREYYLTVQQGYQDTTIVGVNDLPTFGDVFQGMGYLPRILVKARAKLKGQLDPDIMYCCGGDRNFLSLHGNIHPADFLRVVWKAGNSDDEVFRYVSSQANKV